MQLFWILIDELSFEFQIALCFQLPQQATLDSSLLITINLQETTIRAIFEYSDELSFEFQHTLRKISTKTAKKLKKLTNHLHFGGGSRFRSTLGSRLTAAPKANHVVSEIHRHHKTSQHRGLKTTVNKERERERDTVRDVRERTSSVEMMLRDSCLGVVDAAQPLLPSILRAGIFFFFGPLRVLFGGGLWNPLVGGSMPRAAYSRAFFALFLFFCDRKFDLKCSGRRIWEM